MEKIISKILEYVEPDCEITGSSLLKADCGLSSFDMLCLVESLCSEYNVDSEKINIRKCRTVADLAEVFCAKAEVK